MFERLWSHQTCLVDLYYIQFMFSVRTGSEYIPVRWGEGMHEPFEGGLIVKQLARSAIRVGSRFLWRGREPSWGAAMQGNCSIISSYRRRASLKRRFSSYLIRFLMRRPFTNRSPFTNQWRHPLASSGANFSFKPVELQISEIFAAAKI